jgi:hypothetical protein
MYQKSSSRLPEAALRTMAPDRLPCAARPRTSTFRVRQWPPSRIESGGAGPLVRLRLRASARRAARADGLALDGPAARAGEGKACWSREAAGAPAAPANFFAGPSVCRAQRALRPRRASGAAKRGRSVSLDSCGSDEVVPATRGPLLPLIAGSMQRASAVAAALTDGPSSSMAAARRPGRLRVPGRRCRRVRHVLRLHPARLGRARRRRRRLRRLRRGAERAHGDLRRRARQRLGPRLRPPLRSPRPNQRVGQRHVQAGAG